MNNNHKAVVLGTNYYIGLSVIRCLGEKGIKVVGVDYSDKYAYGAKSKYLTERLISPNFKEKPREFIDFLIDYGSKQDYKPVLIPCHDLYVEIVDRYLDELNEHYLISQTDKGLYTKLINKDSLHDLAVEMGVNVPETVRPDEDNFIKKVEETVKYPCIIKPVDSASFTAKFREKIFMINNREELEAAVRKTQAADLKVVAQRIIPGFDDHMYTFDAYLDQNSKVTHWVTCQKYRQYPINFGASVYTGQKYVPELYEIGAKFLEDVKYKGFAEIEFKKDAENGKFYLMEVNVRITNLNSLIHKLGINFPYITYRELTGQSIDSIAIEEDKNMAFWCAFEDFLSIRGYLKTKQLSLGQIIKSLFKPKAYAIWDIKDPLPALDFAKMIFDKLFKKIFTK